MKKNLNDGWKLRCFDGAAESCAQAVQTSCTDWLDVKVPGDVHSTLMAAERIPDPFYSTNIEKCRWVEEAYWQYRRELTLTSISGDAVLTFEGLDTFALIYINGVFAAAHENMFTPAVVDVSELLHTGNNIIDVIFEPVIAKTADKDYSRMWYSYNPNRVWARKAQMNFRWDWGPRMLTIGIWKDVYLTTGGLPEIADVFPVTESIAEDCAQVRVSFGVTRSEAIGEGWEARVSLRDENGCMEQTVSCPADENSVMLMVEHPQLWWTNDLGDAHLYDLTVTLLHDGETVDTYFQHFGIRTVSVSQVDELGRNEFAFVLNGIKLFARGADWVPASSMIGAIPDERYVRWIELAKEANMNMLRIWGGGVYEKDVFYEECDRQGILVWQDFMFTCSSYPDFDDAFMQNVEEEIVHVVKSLRKYTCLAIWCGNNEIQWLHGQKLPELTDLRLYGLKIFEEMMPRLLETLDPSRLYWPSSPFGGNDSNSDDCGDKHNWQVWAGQIYPHKHGEEMKQDNSPYGVSFKRFSTDYGKFCSEFGMHALPVRETLEGCIPEDMLYYESFEMRYRNKDKRPDRGRLLMEEYTGLPKNLDEFIDFSMMAQAQGLKYGIEHYRRRFPQCAGALIWQLNDCWPTMSWSIVDYHLRPKAGYYYTKRVCKNILLSFQEEGPDKFSLWVCNNDSAAYQDTLHVGLKDFFGNDEYADTITVDVPAHSCRRVAEFSQNRVNVCYSNFEFFYALPADARVDNALHYFRDYKDLNLAPCSLHVQTDPSSDEIRITVRTDVLAKFVKITGELDGIYVDDNYFDLMPGEEKTVLLRSRTGEAIDGRHIAVTAINQK